MKEAHDLDGVAMARFVAKCKKLVASGSPVTEIDVDRMLLEVRGMSSDFIEPSFPTIAGVGPNGAIIHYRAEEVSSSESSR